jgi:hypothetical protein
MSQRGRPKNPSASVHVAIAGWLHPEYDADILEWLNTIPKGQRMNAFKAALRNGGLGLEQRFKLDEPDEAQTAADDILGHWEF